MPGTITWVVHISDSSEIDKGKDGRNDKKRSARFCLLLAGFQLGTRFVECSRAMALYLALVETP